MVAFGHTNSTGTSDRALKVIGPMTWPTIGVIADQFDSAVDDRDATDGDVPGSAHRVRRGRRQIRAFPMEANEVRRAKVGDAVPERHVGYAVLDEALVLVHGRQSRPFAGGVGEAVVDEHRPPDVEDGHQDQHRDGKDEGEFDERLTARLPRGPRRAGTPHGPTVMMDAQPLGCGSMVPPVIDW